MKLQIVDGSRVFEIEATEVTPSCQRLFLLNFSISKMLKANFSTSEIGGTGSVQLQGSTNGTTWHDIGDPLTLVDGMLTITDDDNIEIDTDLFAVGSTCFFRLIDAGGSPVSNQVSYVVPGITDYAAGIGAIDFDNNGGDDWTIRFYAALLSSQSLTGGIVTEYDALVKFYPQDGSALSNLYSSTNSADYDFNVTGMGAGVYFSRATYTFSTGLTMTITRLTKVDASGTVLADVYRPGITVDALAGLTITATGTISQVTTSYGTLFAAFNGTTLTPMLSDNPITVTLPSDTQSLIFMVDLDADSEFDVFTGDALTAIDFRN
jgi:hypothetical protein